MRAVRIALRMRDVGVALASAGVFNQPLGKLQLQKYIYLLDALGGVFETLAPSEGHRTYLHGPYDWAIQDAVDSLSFRGLVRIEAVKRHGGGGVMARYRLTGDGNYWVDSLRQTELLSRRFRAGDAIARRVERIGWTRLRELVYAEPTFVERASVGYGQELSPATAFDASTRELVSVICEALEAGWSDFRVSEDAIADVFFRYLDAYSRRGTSTPKGAELEPHN